MKLHVALRAGACLAAIALASFAPGHGEAAQRASGPNCVGSLLANAETNYGTEVLIYYYSCDHAVIAQVVGIRPGDYSPDVYLYRSGTQIAQGGPGSVPGQPNKAQTPEVSVTCQGPLYYAYGAIDEGGTTTRDGTNTPEGPLGC